MDGLQRAFVLHSRPYRETSVLLDMFMEEQGRISLLAKGVRSKRSRLRGYLQPFTPLLISYSGRGQIKILKSAEALSLAIPITGVNLYSGFYLNELLIRVLAPNTPFHALFFDYLAALKSLAQQQQSLEVILRCFEFKLLFHLGYGVDFLHCAGSGDVVVDEMTYQYREGKGFVATMAAGQLRFTGRQLNAFANLSFDDADILQAAKRFTRVALKPYIGSQPLKSRELFRNTFIHR